jgi:prephenate dehydratase
MSTYVTESAIQIHTLGPAGTNCEAAAHHWSKDKGLSDASVILHPTLEKAVVDVLSAPETSVLLACVVYPYLHEIVFKNLHDLSMQDCFVMPTHHMVFAGMREKPQRTVASHPAPVNLLDGKSIEFALVNSNSEAAITCATGLTDTCITTLPAARQHGLDILIDFGAVPMGFSVHASALCQV